MGRRIEFYVRRKGKPDIWEIDVPLEALSPPAQNIAWVLRSTRRHRDDRDLLLVDSVLMYEEIVKREAERWTPYKILNDGCMWLKSGPTQIHRYLSGDPAAEAELRQRYLRDRLDGARAFGLIGKPMHCRWSLPPLYVAEEATVVPLAMGWLENLAEEIRCAGGDLNNIRGAHRAIVNGERYYLSEQAEAEAERISKALFGSR